MGGWLPIDEVVVGDVPVFVVESAGETNVGLAFGVGASDEPLAVRGVSHLCEHLVLSSLGRRGHPYNGMVRWCDTSFFASGSEADATVFLDDIARRVAQPPLGRFDKEVAILSAEADGRNVGPLDALLIARFGARSLGRSASAELGLLDLDPATVARWVGDRFRAGCAAMWVVGPDPGSVLDRLELALPPGGAVPERVLGGVQELPRAIVEDRVLGPHVSFVTPRTVATKAAFTLLHDELLAEIRHERALSYDVAFTFEAIDRETAHAHLGVDAVGDACEAVEAFLQVVAGFAERGPTDEVIDQYRARFELLAKDPSFIAAAATEAAFDRVLGGGETCEPAVAAELAALTPETVADALRRCLPSGLALVPPGTAVTRLFPYAPPSPPARTPDGATFRRVDRRCGDRMIVATDGVTWVSAAGAPTTIATDDCELVVARGDGARLLVGVDGTDIEVHAGMWRHGARLVDLVDRTMAARPSVGLGSREDQQALGAPMLPTSPGLDAGERLVFRTTLWNALLAAALVLLAVVVSGDQTGQSSGAPIWSWRVPAIVGLGALLVVRAVRRGVVLRSTDVEGRRLLTTWRVPWTAVQSLHIVESRLPARRHLLLTLTDGTTRRAGVGRGREGPPCAELALRAHAARNGGPDSYRRSNWPLTLLIASALVLVVSMAVADTGRRNQDLTRAGIVSYTPEEWDELQTEIAVADALSVSSAIAVATTGVGALVWWRRHRDRRTS
jgi:zinc protease